MHRRGVAPREYLLNDLKPGWQREASSHDDVIDGAVVEGGMKGFDSGAARELDAGSLELVDDVVDDFLGPSEEYDIHRVLHLRRLRRVEDE